MVCCPQRVTEDVKEICIITLFWYRFRLHGKVGNFSGQVPTGSAYLISVQPFWFSAQHFHICRLALSFRPLCMNNSQKTWAPIRSWWWPRILIGHGTNVWPAPWATSPTQRLFEWHKFMFSEVFGCARFGADVRCSHVSSKEKNCEYKEMERSWDSKEWLSSQINLKYARWCTNMLCLLICK